MNALVHLDFQRPRARAPLIGLLLLAAGVLAAGTTLLAYRATLQKRAGMELRLEALTRASHTNPADAARVARDAAASEKAARELSTPWTSLLAELESASKDSDGQISLLAVEPDHAKHKVLVNGEAKTLALAIAYVQRLQSSTAMRYPMLDSHELKTDDPQHPVRFELSADWRDDL